MCGKGSDPRPLSIDREEFGRRFDETFRHAPRRQARVRVAAKDRDVCDDCRRRRRDGYCVTCDLEDER